VSEPPHPASGSDGPQGLARPEGELVWTHAVTQSHAAVAAQLAGRLRANRPGMHLLLTTGPEAQPPAALPRFVIPAEFEADSSTAALTFLEHWKPDIGIWTGGDLQPAILRLADWQGIPLILADADTARLPRLGWRWLPDSARQTLKRFSLIMARDGATETFLRRRAGLREARIIVTGALQEGSIPLPCDLAEREELAAILRRRLIWLAAYLHPSEVETVLAANARVMRFSHRVLIIIVPDDPGNAAPFQTALVRAGLRYITWSEGALPDETTQAILADTAGEMGLWYRIAPISFMGDSLRQGGQGSNPLEPAAHGSAILYGPNVGAHMATYSRLARAGAARIVRDAETLAEAVQQVMPPDRSAAMAHAAWEIATRGAEVLERLVEATNEALDARAAR